MLVQSKTERKRLARLEKEQAKKDKLIAELEELSGSCGAALTEARETLATVDKKDLESTQERIAELEAEHTDLQTALANAKSS